MLKRTLRNALALLLTAAALLPAPAYARDEMQNTDPEKYYIEVDTGNQVVTVYQKDDEGEYTRIVRRFICTTGKLRGTEEEPATPTPTGKWKIGTRERFGKFANFAGEYSRYWTQIVGGIYFHSIMFGDRDVETLKKSPFRNLGTNASHGCIRLYVEDAKWLYYNACFGTAVNIVSRSRQKGLTSSLKTDMDFDEYLKFQANIYDEEPLEDKTAWISVDGADLRTGNGTNDKLIKRLVKDTEVKVLQEGDPWIKVLAGEREGYVRRCYITYEKGVMQSRADGYFIAGTQYLYAEPNTKSEKLFKVARHSTIVVTEEDVDEDGKWVKVNYWGTEGYMQRRHLKTGWATIYDNGEVMAQ